MIVSLKITPPNLISWLSGEEKKSNVLLLDLDADIEDEKTLRLDLNVVFNPIAVRRGSINRVDYYVGSSGAEIEVELNGGTIRDHTQAATLDVNYSNTIKRQRKATLNLSPTIKMKDAKTEIETKLGSINRAANDENSFTATFSSEERSLAPVIMGNAVKWSITIPRGEKVIRDFLIGNLYLFATCSWDQVPKKGCISVRPSDVRFFDSERRPIKTLKSILMQFILWRKGIRFQNKDGFNTNFEEHN